MNKHTKQAVLAAALVLPMIGIGYADGGKGQLRPMGGTCVTQFAFTSPTTVYLTGTCHFLHLGLTTLVATQSVTWDPANDRYDIVHDALYTAANGDQLESVTVGFGYPISNIDVELVATETFTGGNGRFEGASGSASVEGTATFTTQNGGIGQFTTAGAISY